MNDQSTFEGFMDLGISNDVTPEDFINDKLVVFSSFGNDSVALIRWLYELGFKNVIVVYSNTGWGSPEWPDRVKAGFELCRNYNFKFVEIPSIGMKEMVRLKKGFPPNGPMQFCTEELKIFPAMIWLQAYDPDKKCVCVNGVRREESQNRKDYPILLKNSPDHQYRRRYAPLAEYDEAMRNDLIKKTPLPILPHKSHECWPCIPNANRRDILALPEWRLAELETFEKSMGFTSKGKPRTIFRPKRHMGAVGIRDVVRWAKKEKFKPDPDYDPNKIDPFDGDDGCITGWCGL